MVSVAQERSCLPGTAQLGQQGRASRRKKHGKELSLEKWLRGGMSNWASASVVRHDGKKPLLLPISSVIAGIRENLDISKAWRDFSLGLCLDKVHWAGFKAHILCFPELTQVEEAVPSLLVPHRRWCHFHTNVMEKRIISPPVQLQSLITWITV